MACVAVTAGTRDGVACFVRTAVGGGGGGEVGMVGALWSFFGGVDSSGPASRKGETCSMGEREVDPAADPNRDDDLESSLVLAVAGVMAVGRVLVGDEYEEVELPGTGFRCMSAGAGDCESVFNVSCLGRNDVNSPKRGPRFPDADPEGPGPEPIVSTTIFFFLVPRLKQATSLCHRPT